MTKIAAPHDGTGSKAGTSKPATVITGASEGIGYALAHLFHEKGHCVVLVARNEERLGKAVDTIATATRARGTRLPALIPLALDVTQAGAPARIAEHLARHDHHLELLINNAGIGLGGNFTDHTVGDIENLLDLNISALTRLMHWAIAEMAPRGGKIINIASLGGYVPGPQQAAYYASKAYVISLSESVAHETRPMGVRVAVAVPGPVDTEFHADMNAGTAFYRRLLPSHTPDQAAAAIYRGHRLGLTVIVPGVFNRMMLVALRLLPHPLTVPIIAWLLRPRA